MVTVTTLEMRAYTAYFRSGGEAQPSRSESGSVIYNEKEYVVLGNTNGILAVYRVRPGGMLKRLKRWPKGVER